MTQAEWDACNEPQKMLEFLRGRVSDRKFRLFLVACCRNLFPLIPESYTRKTVRTAERYADGEVSAEKLRFAWGSARRTVGVLARGLRDTGPRDATARDFALWMVCLAVEADPVRLVWGGNPVSWPPAMSPRTGLGMAPALNECGLLRCIFRNRFRPVTLHPAWVAWNGGTVRRLAEDIYTQRAFDRLPILADALEEAGCTDTAILDHCRDPGPHTRGCWAADLILGRE
jgi:hypothetical protein